VIAFPPPFVTIVTGVPRSGTSLLMQMLRAGGLALLCDEARPSDLDNPRGYFEFTPAKATQRDSAWVAGASGRAVKLAHTLVATLPAGPEYRILLLRRPMAEVVASQRAWLARRGLAAGDLPEARLAAVFRAQLEELEAAVAARSGASLLRVEFARLLSDPLRVAREVRAFLALPLDCVAMAAAVEPALYRQRAARGPGSSLPERVTDPAPNSHPRDRDSREKG
jgi:hypothetical protein